MTVAHVSGHIHLARSGNRDTEHGPHHDRFARLRVGQEIELNVARRLDAMNYQVSLGGSQHTMESSVPLAVGGRIRAVVVAVGDKLELRYLDTAQASSGADARVDDAPGAAAAPPATLVAELAARYRVQLAPESHAQLERAVGGATDPTAMAFAGLYLAKLGVPITRPSLEALHAAQLDGGMPGVWRGFPRNVSTLVDGAASGDDGSTMQLASLVADAMPTEVSSGPTPPPPFGADDDGGDSSNPGELSRWLLNLQDGGNIGYRYGTLPVIVAGELVELDLVVMQQRPDTEGRSPVRRLVMTLQTQSFGQVRIEARALDNRLLINISGQSPQGAAQLACYQEEVRQLAGRLGWNVEGIGYDLDAQPPGAARNIIDHVLSAGTVDLVF